jgi:hypothetical protein
MICGYCGDDHSWLYCRKKPEGWKPPKKIVGRPKDGPAKKSTAAPVSEPRKGQPKPGKGASRTVPQVSHADNRVEVTSGGSDPSRTTGGRHQQPALRTEVALGAADVPLTKRGTPRKRAPKGTFDRKAYHRDLMRKTRAAKAAKEPR